MEDALHHHAVGLAVALGCGLLIGIERERRKGQGPNRAAAGVRTFTIASMTGALSQAIASSALGSAWIVAVGAAVVGAMAWLAFRRSQHGDPGLTTELSLFTTYLIGVLAMMEPLLGAACGVILAGLLALRERLRRFATEVISERELHDGMVLAALALVVLPLAPSTPLPGPSDISLQAVVRIVVLILTVQALGHVAVRLWGDRHGLLLSGFFSGFVSSTATVAVQGARARGGSATATMCAGTAVASGAATWLQALAVVTVVSPRLTPPLVVAALAGSIMAAAYAWWLLRHSRSATRTVQNAPKPTETAGPGIFRLREAGWIAVLLLTISLVVAWARDEFGAAGFGVGLSLGALADSHAAVAAAAAAALGEGDPILRWPMAALLVIGINTASRSVVGIASGGWSYGWRVALGLGLAWGVPATWLLAR